MSVIRFYCKACGGCIVTDAQYVAQGRVPTVPSIFCCTSNISAGDFSCNAY